MKKLLTLLLLGCSIGAFAQLSESELLEKRSAHDSELRDTAAGVLNQEEIAAFHGLDYFDFDSTYQVQATFIKKKGRKFKMPTSTERTPIYRRVGIVRFTIDNTACELEVYQNIALSKDVAYKDYLFIPFRDGTSRIETYGGGRYLDVSKPSSSTLVIDFNQAYNPYCAYSYRYSCPIPPVINDLTVRIVAGEKTPIGH
jgi:uncharacterized protein